MVARSVVATRDRLHACLVGGAEQPRAQAVGRAGTADREGVADSDPVQREHGPERPAFGAGELSDVEATPVVMVAVPGPSGFFGAEDDEDGRQPGLTGCCRGGHGEQHPDSRGIVFGAGSLRHAVEVGADEQMRLVAIEIPGRGDQVAGLSRVHGDPPTVARGHVEVFTAYVVAQLAQLLRDPAPCLPEPGPGGHPGADPPSQVLHRFRGDRDVEVGEGDWAR